MDRKYKQRGYMNQTRGSTKERHPRSKHAGVCRSHPLFVMWNTSKD
jgi:hypothetical protein